MTNKQAFERAMLALNAADCDQMDAFEEHGSGWGASSSDEIHSHIEGFLRRAFKQPTGPEHQTFSEAFNDY